MCDTSAPLLICTVAVAAASSSVAPRQMLHFASYDQRRTLLTQLTRLLSVYYLQREKRFFLTFRLSVRLRVCSCSR